MIGTLYFIQEGDAGAVKIGWTNKPIAKRLSSLQTGNSTQLHLRGLIDGLDKSAERRWHVRFRGDWLRGEWFKPSPRLLAAIAAEAASQLTNVVRLRQLPTYAAPIADAVVPEMREFLQRAFALCERSGFSHHTLSRRLFRGQARALMRLAAGQGCNIVAWLAAKDKLAAFEANPQAVSA